ncbi:uncharacterized protein EV154DRAFT_477054 [Mucor mucedo]|uniref:uncharacterized protein n=1 Tax=Mucor mucedo TaxID=29922 RepID=UPI00222097E9|nr:uncharacterized protein EV154DRAFT_477054 [Mucor mucedo]KAI7895960.1 hypothetical protein EV154DRAFT_477054 [Mucor mucedo]
MFSFSPADIRIIIHGLKPFFVSRYDPINRSKLENPRFIGVTPIAFFLTYTHYVLRHTSVHTTVYSTPLHANCYMLLNHRVDPNTQPNLNPSKWGFLVQQNGLINVTDFFSEHALYIGFIYTFIERAFTLHLCMNEAPIDNFQYKVTHNQDIRTFGKHVTLIENAMVYTQHFFQLVIMSSVTINKMGPRYLINFMTIIYVVSLKYVPKATTPEGGFLIYVLYFRKVYSYNVATNDSMACCYTG